MHLDEGTIHAWLDGALDAEEAARVEQHAAVCVACAAAVAEARGLVAGASRILTALDAVPGGIVPKTVAAGGAARARRTRSLWTTLHLTPVRAAAAAIVVMAAGTALVLRNAPNAASSAIKLANYPTDSAVIMQPAAPVIVPHAAPDTTSTRTLAAPTRRPAPPPRLMAKKAASRPVPDEQLAAVSEPDRRERSVDSIAARKESTMARGAVADNAARGAVAGAAQRAPAAAAPPSAVSQRLSEAATVRVDARSAAGCYIVATDSAISLPPRLWLDSSLVPQRPTMLRSNAAATDAVAMNRRAVSEILNDARRSIASAYWVPRRDGAIYLSLPAIPLNVDLVPTSSSTLVGAAAIGGRSVTVTLRRSECSP